MLPLLLVALLIAGSVLGGVWFGRLQERAEWTRRLYARGINPSTLHARNEVTGMFTPPIEPLSADADAMRDAMADMAREVERLSEGQRFLTDILSDETDGGTRRTPPREDR